MIDNTTEYKVGDIVKLISGGPEMTCLIDITAYSWSSQKDNVIIPCEWFDDKGICHNKNFISNTLINIDDKFRKEFDEEKIKKKKEKALEEDELNLLGDDEVPF